MKRTRARFFAVLIGLLTLSLAAKAAAGRVLSCNRELPSGSQYRDAGWDWTENVTYTLYTYDGIYPDVRLPYYSNYGPAAADLNIGERDIYPEQGWRLVLRDFGDPGSPVNIPYYLLYNTHRCILRMFYFSTNQEGFTHSAGKISYQAEETAAHLTMGARNHFLDNYADEDEVADIVVGNIEPDSWCYFDFNLAGYDPETPDKMDLTYVIQIGGVDETIYNPPPEVDIADGGTVAASKNGFGGLFSNGQSLYNEVSRRYRNGEALRNKMIDWAIDHPGWYSQFFVELQLALPLEVIPALSAVSGIIDFVFGNGEQDSPVASNNMFSLPGTFTSDAALYTLVFRAPGAPRSDEEADAAANMIPMYDQPVGVFNLSSQPKCLVYRTYETVDIGAELPQWNYYFDVYMQEPIQFVYNSGVFRSPTVEVSHGFSDAITDDFMPLSQFNYSLWECQQSNVGIYDYWLANWASMSPTITIRATFQPHDADPGQAPFTLIKTFTPAITHQNGDSDIWLVTGTVLDQYGEPMSDVTINGIASGGVFTDGDGRFGAMVEDGWQGNISAEKGSISFLPDWIPIMPVHENTYLGVAFEEERRNGVINPNGGETYSNPMGFDVEWQVLGGDPESSLTSVYVFRDGMWFVEATGVHVDADGYGSVHVSVSPGNWTDDDCLAKVVTVMSNGQVATDISDGTFTIIHRSKPNDEPDIQYVGDGGILGDPFPNPLNPETTIELNIASPARTSAFVVDIAGRKVRTLLPVQELGEGRHVLNWKGRDDFGQAVSSGLYFLVVSHGDVTHSRKLVMVK